MMFIILQNFLLLELSLLLEHFIFSVRVRVTESVSLLYQQSSSVMKRKIKVLYFKKYKIL